MSACVRPAAEAVPWEPITLHGPDQGQRSPYHSPRPASKRPWGFPAPSRTPELLPPWGLSPLPRPPPPSPGPPGLHSPSGYEPLTGLRVDPGMLCAASNIGSPGAALRVVCKQDRGRPPSWLLVDQGLCLCGDSPPSTGQRRQSSAMAVVGDGTADPLHPAPHRLLSDELRQKGQRTAPHPQQDVPG